MSYGFRSTCGIAGIGYTHMRGYRMRGVGDVIAGGTQLVPVPNYANCDPRDTACVEANQVLSDQYNAAVTEAQASNNAAQCLANASNASTPDQYNQTLAMCKAQYSAQGGTSPSTVFTGGPGSVPFSYSSGAVSTGPTFSFQTPRGSNPQVGDPWSIYISGALPGRSVLSIGSMPSGPFPATLMGQTDNGGNFKLSGTFDATTVGPWSEKWSVGGTQVGSASFTVSKPPSSAPTSPASPANPPGAPAAGPGYTLTPPSGGTVTPPPSSGFDLSSIPWWAWAGAAGVAYFAFKGGR